MFGTTFQAEFIDGQLASNFNGTATISVLSGPSGGALDGTTTVPVTNGVGVFDGLSLSQVSQGTDYSLQIDILSGAGVLASTSTNPIDVTTAATPGVGVYYPLPLDDSLHADVAAADADPTNATDDLYFVYSTSYDLTSGQLVVQNTSGLPSKTLQFLGDDEFATTTPAISGSNLSSVFDVSGSPGLSVLFNGLVIEDGLASDGGAVLDRRRLGNAFQYHAPE